ncbi:MAG: His-Xaa-Ser system protein HxsD [Deltaproteobacteria bacterium HGW-Deltaproteobacteria-14]|nr:MAG: His-Xaa-Ser system protein HxsD [Deltaproteobacteria bacterium HGW-Deltaproteobacteria-14]
MSNEAAVAETTEARKGAGAVAAPVNGSAEVAEFSFELSADEVSFPLDESIYPRDAIFGAAYLFIDRCYVFLTRPADGQVGVRLRPKGERGEALLEALAGEFANELLNQVLRARIAQSTTKIREFYMQRAFFENTPTHSTIDALLAELDEEELADDPLEISVPWEEEPSA